VAQGDPLGRSPFPSGVHREALLPLSAKNADMPAADVSVEGEWFPILTERLTLREFRADDEQDIHEYGGDPQVSIFTDWGPNTLAQSRDHLATRLQHQSDWPRSDVSLAVELRAEPKVIGSASLWLTDASNRTASFGYAFNRRYWNNGYATEASRALLRVAFDVLKLHRVFATCDARNIASWHVMEKLGMRREAEFRQDVFQKGEWRNSYLYAILEAGWPTS
jgi:RimJ/RimL family protein N-acetyltransferase